jgi:protein-S-isoprenylcysteine O-methyltransferase Ste14
MYVRILQSFGLVWALFALVWFVSGLSTKPVARRQTAASRWGQIALAVTGFALISSPSLQVGVLADRILPRMAAVALAGLAITALGIAFAFWARFTLGGNWSGTVTVKEGHTLVQRGPYGLVRHPIYTGLLTAAAGSAFAVGNLGALVGLALVFVYCRVKYELEERFMLEEFGDEYIRYRERVPALVPFA